MAWFHTDANCGLATSSAILPWTKPVTADVRVGVRVLNRSVICGGNPWLPSAVTASSAIPFTSTYWNTVAVSRLVRAFWMSGSSPRGLIVRTKRSVFETWLWTQTETPATGARTQPRTISTTASNDRQRNLCRDRARLCGAAGPPGVGEGARRVRPGQASLSVQGPPEALRARRKADPASSWSLTSMNVRVTNPDRPDASRHHLQEMSWRDPSSGGGSAFVAVGSCAPRDDAGPCVPVRYRDEAPRSIAMRHGSIVSEEEAAAQKGKTLAPEGQEHRWGPRGRGGGRPVSHPVAGAA